MKKTVIDTILNLLIVIIIFAGIVAVFVPKNMHDFEVVDTTTETVIAQVTGKDRTTHYSSYQGSTVSYTICVKWDNGSETVYVDSDTYARYADRDTVELDIITHTLGSGNTRVEYVIREVQ